MVKNVKSRKRGVAAESIVAAHPADKHAAEAWDEGECKRILGQLWNLRGKMLAYEASLAPYLGNASLSYKASARNFAHYLSLRQSDMRSLQEWLARNGLSSLGHSEAHVLANLDKVLGILHRLTSQPWQTHSGDEPVGIHSSGTLLEKHTADLLGVAPKERAVRIMVTLPSEAARDYGFIRRLVKSGMDIARINCAHDGSSEWKAMGDNVRRAALAERRPVRILMDLGGPKLRTGPLGLGRSVLKLKPLRDEFGKMLVPARLGLRVAGSTQPVANAHLHAGADAKWLAQLREGDVLECADARDANRSLVVVQQDSSGVIVECDKTTYLLPETPLKRRRKGSGPRTGVLTDLPCRERELHLKRGGTLRLTRKLMETSLPLRQGTQGHEAAIITCTLPAIFDQVCVGERIWFDDGRIGGVIRRVESDWLEVEITHARDDGESLGGDKGINLPDSQLDLPALTEKDIQDLLVVAKEADMVGLSFVQNEKDIATLRACLKDLGSPKLGIVLKIETRRAFENLPELIFSAMANEVAGVMIARGDLAVECGYERLAEVQEEILWAAEAAHMPVIWATQVLETLAKTGLPSRAEITDAAMGQRAECVMLNKGAHILEAIRTLNDILGRMQTHQTKKRPLLRALRAWTLSGDVGNVG
ncbi:MAG: pyruvate kinase [Rhodocyclaceae bacterium]|nr:pyruvate kinase [Rhodocyclaceae bacterium]